MTAFGLAVAIPAVLAYNVFGRVIGRIEAELEGFAHDLLGMLGEPAAREAPLPPARPMPASAEPDAMAFGRTSLGSSASGGRATGAGGQRPLSDINVTPLVDVMLVLLVIFIITAPLMASSIKLDLPQHRCRPAQRRAALREPGGGCGGQACTSNDQPVDADELAAA